jgi:hypothetical protein
MAFDIPTKSENGRKPASSKLLKYTIQEINSCASQTSGEAMRRSLEHHEALSLQFGQRQLFQYCIDQRTNGSQGMILGDPSLQRLVAAGSGLLQVASTHRVVLHEGINFGFRSMCPIMVQQAPRPVNTA